MFLLSGPLRGKMRECYHQKCDSMRNGNKAEFADFRFLSKTVRTLVATAKELTEAENCLNIGDKLSISTLNMIALIVTMIL